MNRAKLRLSEEEMDLISRADWILTKNRLMERVGELLASLQGEQWRCLQQLSNPLPAEVIKVPAKISRGENYEGLPWMVLDLPRYFTNEHQLAIRTLFWWGHGFSVTLVLKGRYQEMYCDNIYKNMGILQQHQWYLCTSQDPWQHHFRSDNYTPLSSLHTDEIKTILTSHPFLKMAHFIPMARWENVWELVMREYTMVGRSVVDDR